MIELKYSNTNTYLIPIYDGYVLFDTGWAGTFNLFCKALGEKNISAADIKYIFISHFHPDHMGIAQDIANLGARIVVFDVQREFIHFADEIFGKDSKVDFTSIDDEKILNKSLSESVDFLKQIGIDGQVLHTPGHSDDSISLCLDNGEIFVGDLNPLYELELHKGTRIGDSWDKILALKPKVVYYGHAKTYISFNEKQQELVSTIIKYIDKGKTKEYIVNKTKSSEELVDDVMRMYLTHQNISVQGILDRIEIKGK